MRPIDCGDRGENDARWDVLWLDEVTAEWLRGVDAEAVEAARNAPR